MVIKYVMLWAAGVLTKDSVDNCRQYGILVMLTDLRTLGGYSMNYYIEKHDMEIILDALECLSEHIKHSRFNQYPWSADDVDDLFQSFDNSFVENT